jgi:hypothetical protein
LTLRISKLTHSFTLSLGNLASKPAAPIHPYVLQGRRRVPYFFRYSLQNHNPTR